MLPHIYILWLHSIYTGGSLGKESTCNIGDPGSIPGLGRSPGEGNGNPFQHSCLENSMGRGDWQAIVHGVASVILSKLWISHMYCSLHSSSPNLGSFFLLG